MVWSAQTTAGERLKGVPGEHFRTTPPSHIFLRPLFEISGCDLLRLTQTEKRIRNCFIFEIYV